MLRAGSEGDEIGGDQGEEDEEDEERHNKLAHLIDRDKAASYFRDYIQNIQV